MQTGSMITRYCMSDVMNAVVNGLNDYRLSQPTFNHGKYPGM
jgi:pyruvate kinase